MVAAVLRGATLVAQGARREATQQSGEDVETHGHTNGLQRLAGGERGPRVARRTKREVAA